MYFFFDTETNGLPNDWHAPAEQVDNWPRITQLAWAVYNESMELIDCYKELIKPDGWVAYDIPSLNRDGKAYTALCEEKGVPIKEALEKFIIARKSYPFTIAHNISFDAIIVRAEIIRLGRNVEFKAKKICTMQSSTKYCQIPNAKNTGFKWPKLEELHLKLFNSKFDDAHDALSDVKATAKCFFELKRLNIIDLASL